MISICSSIYQQTESVEIFVRSIIANATSPSNLEIIIANDGGYEPTTKVLEKLSKEFPQLKYFTRTEEERIEFLTQIVDFYNLQHIFDETIIRDMYSRLEEYQKGNLKQLWFPPGELFNQAVQRSKGEVLMILPADYLCGFNVTELEYKYREVKKQEGSFVGHLDWTDLTSLDPMPDIYEILHTEKDIKKLKKFIRTCFDRVSECGLTIIHGQHGARILDRESFDKVGGFDGRWFIRAWNDDCFNEKLKKVIAPTYRLMDRMEFQESHVFVGAIRPKNYKTPNYLYSNYSGIPEIHSSFLDLIKAYLNGGGEING